jgi:3D (Asp-Asp-Asp) domain-containing protein
MRKNGNWIKMGFNICKIFIICLIVVGCLWWSSSREKAYEIERFSFNRSLGVNANVVKEKEEEPVPEPVVEPEPKEKKTTNKKYNLKNGDVVASNSYKLKGILTGYGADCPKCGGTLACKSSYKVKNNGVVTYPDSTYGNIRIVASSKNLKCGSVVRFNLPKLSSEPIYAIVLDRGVLGNNLDILMESEAAASKKIGRNTITYEVIRMGW